MMLFQCVIFSRKTGELGESGFRRVKGRQYWYSGVGEVYVAEYQAVEWGAVGLEWVFHVSK